MHRYPLQIAPDGAICEGLPDKGLCHVPRKAIDELRPLLCIDDIPHLILAEGPVLMLSCIGIVRMNLNREIPVGVDQLDEDRDLALCRLIFPCMGAKDLRMGCDKFRERLSRKEAGGNSALSVRMRGALPGLCQGGQVQVL